jgi:sodium transport system permease protein
LLPLVVTLSAISLALAGFAASSKEAQNYLTPLFLVVVMAAAVAQVPDAAPTLALDLVPITGPVLALKEALRSPTIPWLHLLVSTASSVALATVVVSWSVRLLDSESFCYPGLVRAGWGRWRRWGKGPNAPGGLEALGLFALCAAAFLLLGPQLKYFGNVAQIAGPLLLCLGAPVLLYVWAGRYSARSVHLGLPPASSWARGVLAIPLAVSLSIALSTLQPAPPPGDEQAAQMRQMFEQLEHQGGIALILAVIALAPGICEELLCRGPLLAGLRRGLGTSGAVLVSAFCFAVLHLSPYRFLPQFAIGVFLALLTLRSGSLWPGVIVHVGHNALAVLLSGGDESDEPQLSTSLACVIGALALVGLGLLVRPRTGGQALAKDQTTPLVDAQS